jgi:hypothetical protein
METKFQKNSNTMNSITDLKECYCSGVKPEIAYEYEFYINETPHRTKNQVISGLQIHQFAGTNPTTHFISMKTRSDKTLIGPNIDVDLTDCGIERFTVLPFEQQALDLHDCFCQGSIPYITYKYLIKINGDKYEVFQEEITGLEILKLAGKNPENNRVKMFSKGGKVLIGLQEVVDLTACGVERFVIEPLDCTEGFIKTDLPLQLLEEDLSFLDKIGVVNSIDNGSSDWLVLRSCTLPDGYNVQNADVAFMIPKQYPAAALDMFYFYPPLTRADGLPIGALTLQTIEGKDYQRWSRHRTGDNTWDPEIDSISSHYDLMINCLKSEFKKR